MSDNTPFGFAKLVPGFDFLQNLAKGAAQNIPQLPNLSNWVAPTLNVEELDKRITELKAVHYWLEQNGKALGATIQALEVQKMTLATLQGMNFSMGEVANALAQAGGARQRVAGEVDGAQPHGVAPAKPLARQRAGFSDARPATDEELLAVVPARGLPVVPVQPAPRPPIPRKPHTSAGSSAWSSGAGHPSRRSRR